MFTELNGAKIVAPYFGTSLYVWASAIGVSLGSLALGYFTGGYLSKKVKSKYLLFWLFLLSGIFITIMPTVAVWIMQKTIEMSIQTGVTISMLVFLTPPLLLCGMISPVIIKELTTDVNSSGKISGLVYSISTLGGIVLTYLTGFYLLPEFGISKPSVVFGTFIVALALFYLLFNKKYIALIAILFVLKPLTTAFKADEINLKYKVLYDSEGVFGQVKVVDQKIYTHTRGWQYGRNLFVNNISQSSIDLNNNEYSLWDFSYYFPLAASNYKAGSNALILGMGAGTLMKQFHRLGFNVKAVEIDKRIADVAYKYFNLAPKHKIIIDDARHYLKTEKEIFDIIAFDLFQSETPPIHLLTKESFLEVKNKLTKNGLFMLNFYGFITGENGQASRAIYKTLLDVGFKVKILSTPGKTELNRNIIFLASFNEIKLDSLNYSEPNVPIITNLENNLIDLTKIDFTDAILLSDNYPIMEKLYINAALDWRIANNKTYSSMFLNDL